MVSKSSLHGLLYVDLFPFRFVIAASYCVLLSVLDLNFAWSRTLSPNRSFWHSAGVVSAGVRSTVSLFSTDGVNPGLGTGGHHRIQLSPRVNTEWYLDYILIHVPPGVRSLYYHIGWSVLFYLVKMNEHSPSHFLPYILAGHCFDYNRKSLIANPEVFADRWGSAVQAGLGTHYFLTMRADLSLTVQYMFHLTKEIRAIRQPAGSVHFASSPYSFLEGHLLITVSVSYRLFRLWGGNNQ